MAERRKTAIEAYESRVKSVLINVADYLAKGVYSSPPYRISMENFGRHDIESIATFLGRETVREAAYRLEVGYEAVEIGSFDGRTYLLRNDGQIMEMSQAGDSSDKEQSFI